jgi:O-acetyl-ADP-ribose deacetylase (regulator of RNase III)
VVNAANNHLHLGAGVAGAILQKGGRVIQDECDEYVREHGPLEIGDAAVTSAGALPARYVIHAAAMGDAMPTPQSIRDSTRRSLELAEQHFMKSVAFPILGSGIGAFPYDEAARIMLDEIRSFKGESGYPDLIVLYGFTAEQAEHLQRLLV